MRLNDYGKLILLLAILGCTTLLAALDTIDPGLVEKVLLLELGYVIGNGVNALRRQDPSPVLTQKPDKQAEP